MTLPGAVAAAMFVGVVTVCRLRWRRFRFGVDDLSAGRGKRGAELRTLVDGNIGTVSKANHVRLICVLVMWWTGFPVAFAAAMTTLLVPWMLALAGIVLRGSSFALRK